MKLEKISSLELTKLFSEKPITTELYENVRTDEALGYILDAAGFSSIKRIMQKGNVTLDWFWVEDEGFADAVQGIMAIEGEGASLYEDEQGNIVFNKGNAKN